METEKLLQVRNLKKHFAISKGSLWAEPLKVHAVDGVTFDLYRGETLGLVGESGCGKSTTGRLILRLLEATEGEVLFEDKSVLNAGNSEMHALRQKMQIVFQDPYSSMNPRMTVEQIVGEGIVIHKLCKTRQEVQERVADVLQKVGLRPEHMHRYPHEFSGGQRQRVGIARALAVNAELIVADEAISALDVSIQAQVINLLEDIQEQFNLTYLFISHDLRVVEHISDRVAVMYLGKIVELADRADLYEEPLHPYTEALLSAIPIADPTLQRDRLLLAGDPPSPINLPKGCRFQARCHKKFDRCMAESPELREVSPRHWVACHLY